MIDKRYESPGYRGPELGGLTTREAFDLAKSFRIALRHKREADRMAAERERATKFISFWAVAFGLSLIVGGLAAAVWVVGHIR